MGKSSLASFIGILVVILFSAGTALVGIGKMILSLIQETSVLPGLELFFLGSILFTVTLIAYTAVKILNNTDIIATSLTQVLESMDGPERINPLEQLFGGGGFPGGFPMGSGTMRIARMDKDGTIHNIGEREFNSHEEFLKYRDELINKARGESSGKKPVSEMTLEELESERIAAEAKQDFELCAALRNAIEEKKKKKD